MGLIIIGVILLLLLIVLFSPFRLYVQYKDKKPYLQFRYLFFKKTLVGGKPKASTPAKKKAPSQKGKKEKKKEEKPEKKKSGLMPESLSGKIELAKGLIKAGGKALRRLIRRIKIKELYIDIDVSDEDAYECALKFGKTNIIVYNAVTLLSQFVRIRKKSIAVKCIYNRPESVYNISCTVCITPAALICIALALAFAFLAIIIKSKKNKSESPEKETEKKAA